MLDPENAPWTFGMSPFGVGEIVQTISTGRLFRVYLARIAGQEVCVKAVAPGRNAGGNAGVFTSAFQGIETSLYDGCTQVVDALPVSAYAALAEHILVSEAQVIQQAGQAWNHRVYGLGIWDGQSAAQALPPGPTRPDERFGIALVMPHYPAAPLSSLQPQEKKRSLAAILPGLWDALGNSCHGDLSESNILVEADQRTFHLIDPGVLIASPAVRTNYADEKSYLTTNPANYPLLPPFLNVESIAGQGGYSLAGLLSALVAHPSRWDDLYGPFDLSARVFNPAGNNSPETLRPGPSDLLALGILYYRALTGKDIFREDSFFPNTPAWVGKFGETGREVYTSLKQAGQVLLSGYVEERLSGESLLLSERNLAQALLTLQIESRAHLQALVDRVVEDDQLPATEGGASAGDGNGSAPFQHRSRHVDWKAVYSPLRPLGRGGMGETWLARDPATGKEVCVKLLHGSTNPAALSQEVLALQKLHDACMVHLLDFDLQAHPAYFVSEYIRGVTLAEYLAHHRPLPETISAYLVAELMRALAHSAHPNGVIHCDLKPGNILLAPPFQPKMIDFGLSIVNRVDDRGMETGEGRMAGTPHYMAPEQFSGDILTPAVDVYALGQILWEMLVGRRAFPESNPYALGAAKSQQKEGLRIEHSPYPVSPEVKDLVARCTHPDPGERPAAMEAWKVLDGLIHGWADGAITLFPLDMQFSPLPAGKLASRSWSDSLGYVSGVSTAYDFQVVDRPQAGGEKCVQIRAGRGVGEKQAFGSLMQRCPAQFLAGKRIRFSGDLCSDGLDGWAGLWLRGDGLQTHPLFFDNMGDRPIRGTTAWKRFTLLANVPAGIRWLNFGVLVVGAGTVWADHFRLEAELQGEWVSLAPDASRLE
ncbi:MAG: serine/threonine-protein kinase [Anaerolineaceae bacterium]|nr:serine/threonine-protein kinase [Anaerolineaceae bacterium]